MDRLLVSALSSALGPTTRVVARQPNSMSSTYPSEIIRVRSSDGSERTLFCKWGTVERTDKYSGSSRIAYERRVYERVLRQLDMGTPPLVGGHEDLGTGQAVILLENSDAAPVRKGEMNHRHVCAAACWLGAFHRAGRRVIGSDEIAFIDRYTRAYYEHWGARASESLSGWLRGREWLRSVLHHHRHVATALLSASQTIVHGEFHRSALLVTDDRVCPVDWETAAIGPGEIDLATLTDGWSPATVAEARESYVRHRLPEHDDFELTFAAARVHVQLRRFGSRMHSRQRPPTARRLDELHDAAVEFAALGGLS